MGQPVGGLPHKHTCMHIHDHRSVTDDELPGTTNKIHLDKPTAYPSWEIYCIISITVTLRKSCSVQTETLKNYLFEATIYRAAFHNS